MKKSIIVATFMVVGAGAMSASAIVSPFQGSDTLYNVTTQAIAAAGLLPANAYIGGGSGNAQSAMVAGKQVIGPMSRMLNNGASVCSFGGGTAGSKLTSTSDVVIGLDAVAMISAASAGGSATCNGTADNSGTGLAYSGTAGVFANGNAGQTWKWVLALVYGGLDLSNPSAGQVCDSAARKNLVANWSQLFQNGCANGASSVCSAAPINGALWHAYRRDDTSGTSDVFSSLLGITPSTSNSALHGFGTSPYCNALNWDQSTANGGATGNCTLGANKQWIGPGGVLDPVANDGVHRRPPPGTWGDTPDPTQGALGADVLPTQLQDNDPIRRTCLGSGATNVHPRVGEEVCNINGTLGLVLPMVDSDWMTRLASPLLQYPTNACTGFLFGKPANVFTCAPRGNKHSAECPDGDYLDGGACLIPIDGNNNTSQCVASKSTQPPLLGGGPNPVGDGRYFNTQMHDGTAVEPTIGYAQYNIPSITATVDFAGVYNRIHQVETVYGSAAPNPVGCQMVDMTDQIGCLAQADPCSIGYAGFGSQNWSLRTNGAAGAGGSVGAIGAMRVAQVAPVTASVQALGLPGEYQVARKLYLSSVPGFNNLTATALDTNTADEVTLANDESTPSFMNPIMLANDFFKLGAQSPAGADTQFCEDFNEQVVCNTTPASPSTLPANVNGCTNNPAPIPSVGTICGDGVKGAYEECDNGTANGTTGNHCSQTCRCTLDFNEVTGVCN